MICPLCGQEVKQENMLFHVENSHDDFGATIAGILIILAKMQGQVEDVRVQQTGEQTWQQKLEGMTRGSSSG